MPRGRSVEFRSLGDKGAWGELVVSADLIRRGFEVFRALSPHATCDLLLLAEGLPRRIEVRTVSQGVTCMSVQGRGSTRFDILAIVLKDGQVVYDPPLDDTSLQVVWTGKTSFVLMPQCVEEVEEYAEGRETDGSARSFVSEQD